MFLLFIQHVMIILVEQLLKLLSCTLGNVYSVKQFTPVKRIFICLDNR